jgi:chemotaxis protein histidine kinase CheA
MLFSIEIIEELEKLEPALRSSLIKILKSLDKTIGEMVKKEDFLALKAEIRELAIIVKELAEAQKKTEQTVAELAEAQKKTEQTVAELAEAQKKSEERLTRLEQTVAELIEAHNKSEERLTRLEQTVAELIEAQKKTEQRLNELAEAQKKFEERLTRLEKTVAELAEAQKRTEEEIRKLASEHRETRKMLGNLADTVGYGLEDKIIPLMKKFAEDEYGIKVKNFGRKNIVYPDGKFDELNIYVEGKRDGKTVYLIGECKAHLGKRDIEKFSRIIERVRQYLRGEVQGFVVSYTIQPDVEEYLKKFYPEIKFYYSYYFDLKYRYGETI